MFVRPFILFIFFVRIIRMSTSQTGKAPDFDDEEFVPRVVNGWPAKLGDVPYQDNDVPILLLTELLIIKQLDNLPGNMLNAGQLVGSLNFWEAHLMVAFKAKIPRHKICMTFCGGVIISPTKLLSAAHCFAKDPNICQRLCGGKGSKRALSHVYAVAGNLRNNDFFSEDSAEHGQWRTLKSVEYPKTYKFPKDDIAILFTFKPFILNNYINAIPFASRFTDYRGKCLVSGYGRISNKESSSKLLLAHLDLLPIYDCNRKFRKNMRKFVCTSTLVTDVGKGDSGGPLVCMKTGDPNEGGKGVLVGIVSGNKYRVGSFFTRVSYFSRYIERNKSYSIKPLQLSLSVCLIYATFLLF